MSKSKLRRKVNLERIFGSDGEAVMGVGDITNTPIYFTNDFIPWLDLCEFVMARNNLDGWN